MREYTFFVYIITNPAKSVLYTGFTNNIEQRLIEHYMNRGKKKTFAGRYFCYNLLYYEIHRYVNNAIGREKQIKGWTRLKKTNLIKQENPQMRFLNSDIMDWPPEKMEHR